MIALWSDRTQKYDGSQLRPHFASELMRKAVMEDYIVAFAGPAHVVPGQMVDVEDTMTDDYIRADLMLHFIVEMFGWRGLDVALLKLLLIDLIAETLRGTLSLKRMVARIIKVEGDDILIRFAEDEMVWAKLTVAISTVSGVSGLIHIGVNVKSTGAPEGVRITGLEDLGVNHKQFATRVIHETVRLVECVERELKKTYPVR